MTNPRSPATRPRKGGGARLVHDALKAEILTLALPPGATLDETALAERFGLSRSPVREALVRLSSEGLVMMLSNRSSLVAPLDLANFPRYTEGLDVLQRVTARLAARNRKPADLDAMRAAAAAFDAAALREEDLAMSAGNRDFHMAVAAAGGNPWLTRAYGQMLDEGRRMLHMHFAYLRASAEDRLLDREHWDMIDAVAAQDVAAADRLAHAHTRQFHDRFMRFLQARYEQDCAFDMPPAAV